MREKWLLKSLFKMAIVMFSEQFLCDYM